jgi:pimeloyl-ACP methyl ester carboxylesterase
MEKLSVNGIDLAYEVRGDGPPLLMLHGFFGSSGDWLHLFDLDALAKRWRLVMPDARGHGRSTNPSGLVTHRQAAEDIRALLDHLGIERWKGVGVSFGGNILLHLATAPATATASRRW